MKKRFIGLCACLILVLLDQTTKYIFYNLQIWNQISFLSPLINTWISRGISIPMIVILIVSLFCLIVFSYLFHKKYLSILEYSMFMAWTVWNLIDRLFLHGVRDFISIWNFPVFNFADMLLTCWVALVLIEEIFHLQTKWKKIP